MTTFVALAALAVGSYGLRVAFVGLLPSERLPMGVQRVLPHLTPAVFAALAAQAMRGYVIDGANPGALAAFGVAILVAWRTRDLTWTIAAGAAIVTALQLVG